MLRYVTLYYVTLRYVKLCLLYTCTCAYTQRRREIWTREDKWKRPVEFSQRHELVITNTWVLTKRKEKIHMEDTRRRQKTPNQCFCFVKDWLYHLSTKIKKYCKELKCSAWYWRRHEPRPCGDDNAPSAKTVWKKKAVRNRWNRERLKSKRKEPSDRNRQRNIWRKESWLSQRNDGIG